MGIVKTEIVGELTAYDQLFKKFVSNFFINTTFLYLKYHTARCYMTEVQIGREAGMPMLCWIVAGFIHSNSPTLLSTLNAFRIVSQFTTGSFSAHL
jgi:hypothetical protein